MKVDRFWTKEEILEVSITLEEYHRVFTTFWTMASIEWTGEESPIQTAAVRFPEFGKPSLMVNFKFWESLNAVNRIFVIAHECLHVMLDHGIRNAKHVPGATPRLINIAQDITINEIIRDMFDVDREYIQNWEKFCWIDTCFDDWKNVLRHQNFYYYLDLLIKQNKELNVQTLDSHDIQNGCGSGGHAEDILDDIAGRLAQELSWEELQKMISAAEKARGRGVGDSPFSVVLKAMEPSELNFTELTKKLERTAKGGKGEKVSSTFARKDRRFNTLGPQFILPGKLSQPKPDKKLLIATFFDVSGSCMGHFEKFMKISAAFESKPDVFELHQHIFDTKVTPVKTGHKIQIGGGTHFSIIEARCRELAVEKKRYPDCVVVITDGYGNDVHPTFPKRWIWLLTPDGSPSFVSSESQWCRIDKVVF